MQSLCGVELPAGQVIASPDGQFCRVGIYFEDEGLVRPALEVAHGLLTAAIDETSYDFASQTACSCSRWPTSCASAPARVPSSMRPAAERIPVRRLNENSFVAVWARGPAAADLHGRDRRHRRHCRVDRPGQGTDQVLLERVGVPVPKGRTAVEPRGSLGGGLRDRPAGRRQAARRKPRPRRDDQAERPRSDHGRLRSRGRRRQRRAGRAICPGTSDIGCWSSATAWWPRRAPSPNRSSATASTRSASWSIWSISIRGGAKNTRCR